MNAVQNEFDRVLNGHGAHDARPDQADTFMSQCLNAIQISRALAAAEETVQQVERALERTTRQLAEVSTETETLLLGVPVVRFVGQVSNLSHHGK